MWCASHSCEIVSAIRCYCFCEILWCEWSFRLYLKFSFEWKLARMNRWRHDYPTTTMISSHHVWCIWPGTNRAEEHTNNKYRNPSNALTHAYTHAHIHTFHSIQFNPTRNSFNMHHSQLYLRNAFPAKITPFLFRSASDAMNYSHNFRFSWTGMCSNRNAKWLQRTRFCTKETNFSIEFDALSSSRTNGLFSNGFSAPF